jgi:hypothetical protein
MLKNEFVRSFVKRNFQKLLESTAKRAFTISTKGLLNYGQSVTFQNINLRGGCSKGNNAYMIRICPFSGFAEEKNDKIVVSEFPIGISTVSDGAEALKLLTTDQSYTEESVVDALTSVYSLLVNNTENCALLGEKGGCDYVVDSLRKQLTKSSEDISSTVICLHQVIIGMLSSNLTLRDNLNKFALNGCLSGRSFRCVDLMYCLV